MDKKNHLAPLFLAGGICHESKQDGEHVHEDNCHVVPTSKVLWFIIK